MKLLLLMRIHGKMHAHDEDVFKFKQSVIEYLSKAKRHQSNEVNSVISSGSHRTRKSNHSKRSISSSISSKAKLIEAKTKVAALEIEASFPYGKASA